MPEEGSMREIIKNIPTLTKVAAVFFIIGKIHFIPAAGFALVDMEMAWIFTGIYVFCITMAIILSMIDIFKLNAKDKKAKESPSVQYIERWAKEYNLLKGER